MRDAVSCEMHGRPAVVVVLDVLMDIARATAESYGAHQLVIVGLDATLFGIGRSEVEVLSRGVAQAAVGALKPA